MIRIVAAAAAVVVAALLGACGSGDSSAGGLLPSVPSAPSMPAVPSAAPSAVPSFDDTSTAQPSTAALPLPKGCDLLSKSSVRKYLNISAAGQDADSSDVASCTYTDTKTYRTLIVAGWDFDTSNGSPQQVLDQYSQASGSKQPLAGVGDVAEISSGGMTGQAAALRTVGSHYRMVQLIGSYAPSMPAPDWRSALTPLLTEALTNMMK